MSEAIDTEILRNLTLAIQEMTERLKVKGVTDFTESAETERLRVSIVLLIGELQFHKVLPANFHVNNGEVVNHEEHKEEEKAWT